jgi:KDO2-lipid IV(A) lauroyltransferase
VYLAVRTLSLIVVSVSRSAAMGIGSFAGFVIYAVVPKQSRKALENLKIAYNGSMSDGELRRMTRTVFIHLGRNLAEVLRLPRVNSDNVRSLVSVRGQEKMDDALARGRGVIAITGHLGCWELLPAYFSLVGYPVSVVGRRVYDSRVDSIVRSLRANKGVVLVSDRDTKEALAALHSGRALGVLIDEKAGESGIPVDFFGGRSRVTRGPAVLSMRAGAPIVPVGIHRGSHGRHIIEIGDPINLEKTADIKSRIPEYARTCSKAVEKLIRKHPTEWVWMHDKFER